MTVKDIVDHCPDNKIKLRDYESGKMITDAPISMYWDYKVVKFYGRSYKCGPNFQVETDIVVMIRVNLDKG